MDLPVAKRPRNDTKTEDLPEPSKLLLYAGEGDVRDRFNDIVKYKLTGVFPDDINKIKLKYIRNKRIRDFLMTSHNYLIKEEEISPLSKSKLCYKDEKNNSLLAVPYQSEVPNILKTLHIENNEHFTREYTIDRAKIFKVKWPGVYARLREFINDCKCQSTRKKDIFQKPSL